MDYPIFIKQTQIDLNTIESTFLNLNITHNKPNLS